MDVNLSVLWGKNKMEEMKWTRWDPQNIAPPTCVSSRTDSGVLAHSTKSVRGNCVT